MSSEKLISEKTTKNIRKFREIYLAIWKAKKGFILFNSLVFIILFIILLFFVKPSFDSTIVVLPEFGSKSSSLSKFADLANIAGVKVGETNPTEIYSNLILGEAVLENVIYSKYSSTEFQDSVNLIEYFEVTNDNNLNEKQNKRLMFIKVYKELINNRIETVFDRTTKILTIKVTMPESELSSSVANQIINSLESYIKTKRKSFAIEQRVYLEKRVEQVKDSLLKSEDRLRSFKEMNRIIFQSPSLLLSQARMMRDIEILQAVYVELCKQLEIAKIDEIKDTPVLNIREDAREPIKKSGPKRVIITLVSMMISFLISVFYILNKEKIKIIKQIIKSK